jgi:hypothetical protein
MEHSESPKTEKLTQERRNKKQKPSETDNTLLSSTVVTRSKSKRSPELDITDSGHHLKKKKESK